MTLPFRFNGFMSFGSRRRPRMRMTNTQVVENVVSGTDVGALSVVFGSGSYTFSLLDDAGGKFALAGATLQTNATIDYETNTFLNVVVRADNGSSHFDQGFTIGVINDPTDDGGAVDPSTMDFDTIEGNPLMPV